MEAEDADPGAQVGESAVGDPFAPVGAEDRVEPVEVGEQLGAVRVGVVGEAPPDLDEPCPKRLVLTPQLGHRSDDRGRHAPRGAERRQLVADELANERPCPLERVLDRVRPRVRIAVQVAADPGAEAKRHRAVVDTPAERAGDPRNRVPEALLEEPEAAPDLVDDLRAPRAHLVGLPEDRDLLRQRLLDPRAAGGRDRNVVELGEEPGDPPVGLQHRPARRLGGMRGQHELHHTARRRLAQLALRRPRSLRGGRTPPPATRWERGPRARTRAGGERDGAAPRC